MLSEKLHCELERPVLLLRPRWGIDFIDVRSPFPWIWTGGSISIEMQFYSQQKQVEPAISRSKNIKNQKTSNKSAEFHQSFPNLSSRSSWTHPAHDGFQRPSLGVIMEVSQFSDTSFQNIHLLLGPTRLGVTLTHQT